MDDTPQEQMRDERMERKHSYRRDTDVKDNMGLFEKMCAGDKKAGAFCLRAKMDMSSDNGTLRDPVLYRANAMPHHRTGTKYKAYPTYDLACPIVDSHEGVTHALRTTEYNDRNAQYQWIIKALKLRPVLVHEFSRLNFVYTLLSKRKLAWFVDNGKVSGWDDPRFPTIRGVLRRGVSVPALKEFIRSQGASRNIVEMEWDFFWSLNKREFEETAPRLMAVASDTAVKLTVTNFDAECGNSAKAVGRSIPVHPKNPALGVRCLRLSKTVLLEGSDANAVAEGQLITLMRWGTVKITAVEKDADGTVTALSGAFDKDGDFKKTAKLSWLAETDAAVSAVLCEYDHLITKKKVEADDKVEDLINPHSQATMNALCDPLVRNLQHGQVVQLERRGFYRVDALARGTELARLILIPDGKVNAMSALSGSLGHR